MNVASLELCKELYEVSGWEDKDLNSRQYNNITLSSGKVASVSAYDLGYLLRKLPKFYEEHPIVYLLTVQPNPIGAGWQAHYRFASRTPNSSNTGSKFRQDADTPEDAATKLCIELFKQKILTKDNH